MPLKRSVISEIAYKNGLTSEDCSGEIIDALLENHLPISCPYRNSELYEATVSDKKCAGGRISIIIPDTIGKCSVKNISISELKGLLG